MIVAQDGAQHSDPTWCKDTEWVCA